MFTTVISSRDLENKNNRWWKPPTNTVERATYYLNTLYNRIRFLNLYQKIFPVEYAASTASTVRPEKCYCPKEEEFLNLVNTRLFGLPDIAFDPDFGSRTATIPISLGGVQTSCECGSPHADNFPEHWQVVMVMTGIAEPDDCSELPFEWESYLHQLQYAGKPATEALQSFLDEHAGDDLNETGHPEDAPIRYFSHMVDVVCQNTGNIFYDVENSLDHDLIWNEENIKFLTEQWNQYQEIEKKLDELILWWTEAGPRAMKILVKIWNKLGDAGEIDLMGLPEMAYDLPLSENEEFLNG